MRTHTTRGFTLVELLIVIGIMMILAGVSSVVYGNLQQSAQLNETGAQMTQNLRVVREQSNAGKNNAAHGIRFEPSRYTLFQGATYATRESAYDRVYTLAPALSLTTTFVGDEVVFSKGVGTPTMAGTITMVHSVSGSKTILVEDNGTIQEQ